MAVIGAGPIGLGRMMLGRAGGTSAVVVDVVQHSLHLATDLGADVVVNSRLEVPVNVVTGFSDGLGVDVAFECVIPDTLHQATTFARRGGKVVMVGGYDPGRVAIDLDRMRVQKSEIQLI